MALDGFVRCTCIRDGKAKPHPFPDRLVFDESGEPILSGDPSEEEWEAHDKWLGESCEHEGFLLSLFSATSRAFRICVVSTPLAGQARTALPHPAGKSSL